MRQPVDVRMELEPGHKLITVVQITESADGRLSAQLAHIDPMVESRHTAAELANLLRWLADATEIAGLTTTD